MKSIFLNVHDLDDLGARLYLACGDPENALHYIKECLLTDPEKKELKKEAVKAMAAKSRATALMEKAIIMISKALTDSEKEEFRREPAEVMATQSQAIALKGDAAIMISKASIWDRIISCLGLSSIQKDNMTMALELLKKAQTIYNRDPILNINLGLALQRAGDFEMAAALLGNIATVAPEPFMPMCYANAAFCLIEAGNFPLAIHFLSLTMSSMSYLMLLIGENSHIPMADLPGKGIFVDRGEIIEEALPSAHKLIDYAVKEFSKQEEVPEDVLHLVGLYRSAASRGVKSNS